MDSRLIDGLRAGRFEAWEYSLVEALLAEDRLAEADALRAVERAPAGGIRDWLAAEKLVEVEVLDACEASIRQQACDATNVIEPATAPVQRAPSPAPAPTPTERPLADRGHARGTRVGLAVLERPLGAGGMGEVWLAQEAEGGRQVAVKFLIVDEEDAVQRFLREIDIVARLRHPGIPQMLESGEHAGQAFVTMEYVAGGSLEGMTFSPRETAQVLRDAADALAYAHEAGVIHRDLKPANLIRTPSGTTYVIDFGLARAVEEATRLTATGTLLGSPNFMAPEQALGLKADHRSDLYALAATAYALRSGRPPIVGKDLVHVLRLVASTTPEPLPETEDLARIVNRGMGREREDRYPSARALLEDLDAYLEGRTLPSRERKGLLGRLQSWFGSGSSQ